MNLIDCKLSIIIVSYNTKGLTNNCIASIYKSILNYSFEIIVVDNHSTDGSVEMIREKYPSVILVENTTNFLFAIANNQGAKIARGEFLLLLNSDTLVSGDNLQKMVSFFSSLSHQVICVGPKILNMDNSIQSSGYPNPGLRACFCLCFRLYRILPSVFVEKCFGIKGLPRKKKVIRQVGWVSGACMMVRTKEYLAMGGLNENIEFYGEEPEFGYRTAKFHYQTFYYPYAEIVHYGGQSTKKITDDEIKLRRYALLQRETVGYSKSIWMSRIVLASAYLKKIISSNKEYFIQAILWEKKVIHYLQIKRHEETSY